MRVTGFLLFFFITLAAFGQKYEEGVYAKHLVDVQYQEGIAEKELGVAMYPVQDLKPWNPGLINLGFSHDVEDPEALKKIKKEKDLLKAKTELRGTETEVVSSTAPLAPSLGTNFTGNLHNGFYPPDNSMAISNGGIIISVTNSTIYYFNSSGTQTYANSFASHFSSIGPTATIFDPVVIYDPDADRFVVVALHGGTSSTSAVIVSFSQTNDPADGWWTYIFETDSDIKSTRWFDYPKVGVNDNEVFIGGNLFRNSGGGFDEGVIMQLDKADGYAGASLTYDIWLGINAFTPCPLTYGQNTTYGPEMWFAHNFSGGGTKVFLKVITDKLGSSPSLNTYSVDVTAYSPTGNADQMGTSNVLDNGDCRVQGGFWLNNMAHFVFNTDFGSGSNGLYYARVSTVTLVDDTRRFGLAGSDYTYPSIASFATSPTDKSVAIAFTRCSSAEYPSIRVVSVDDVMNFSSSISVKPGEDFVNLAGSSFERWGDYTGIARKHNAATRTVWMAACYGNTSNSWTTHIAEIGGTGTNVEELEQPLTETKVYPNPIIDMFHLEFELDVRTMLDIRIYDIQGREVKQLYYGKGKPGTNRFFFNKAALEAGTYIIKISDEKNEYVNQKIVVAE